MATVTLFNAKGDKVKDLDVADSIFGIVPNVHEMHRHLVRQLANNRAGTHSTLTRSEVSGGGKKPWRQKGTGRARSGSTRSPLWRTGGVVFGPKPRSYEKDLPRKIRRLAIKSALATRKDAVVAIESFDLPEIKTKAAVALLEKLGAVGKVVILLDERNANLELSVRNLPDVKVILATQFGQNLNVKDILRSDKIVATQAALTRISEVFA
ncbi:MAG: 50S ribosomal protein L4 [Candidatus Sericytochromatia bacterium]|nr:50S ribosomal protein L4 [Candidatus Tanganyikabacteria bacterium]